MLFTTQTNDRATFFTDAFADRRRHPAPDPEDGRRVRGDRTRRAILTAAVNVASVEGLEGLSIGRLATELEMSKSGLFAHFGSKEELQIATVRAAAAIFAHRVVLPAQEQFEPGIARLHGMLDNWLDYMERRHLRRRLLLRRRDDRDGRPPGPGARRPWRSR